ncbi:MAG: glycosyltransferase family 39 protein [Ardenticatenaceae bacterium]|nr:glycosyltransferase family 39 protein [Ardenticatenaceae bacterium]MCB9443732.1 glycosyltransferase family 39 protein [Ardenticatenaceae bacterium]
MAEDKDPAPRFRIKNGRILVWLLIVLIDLLVAQWWLWHAVTQSPFDSPPWLAVLLLGVAVLALFAGLSARMHRDVESAGVELSLRWLDWIRPYGRWLALIGAIVAITIVLRRIPHLAEDSSYTAVFWLWLLAILFYFGAVVPRSEWQWPRPDWLQKRDGWFWGVVVFVGITLLLRVWQIGTIPFTLSGDEGSQGLEAIEVINGSLRNPFTTGWLGVPTMSFFFNAISIRLLGRTIVGLRLPWALVGTATVVVVYFLVKRIGGRRLGMVTAVLLATYHYHIHYSRLGSNQIADPLFLALAMLLLMRARDGHKRLDWALLGAVNGLAFYFYAGARLTPVVVTAALGYWFVLNPKKFWREHGGGILVAVWAFLLTAAPMIQYAVRFPNDFNARLNQVGIIQSGWLEREVEIRGESQASILFDQFQRAALAFNYYADRTVWYGLSKPLLDPFFGGLFLLGLLYGTLRLLTPKAGHRLAPMVAWWWGGMILGGMLTESPPSSQRLITLAVPTCFFLAFALTDLLKLARQAVGRIPEKVVLAVVLFIFAFTSLKTYFVDYTSLRVYGGQNAEMATQIAPLLNELKYDHEFKFVGAPWMYWGFATLPYLVPDAVAGDIIDLLVEPVSFDVPTADKGVVFIVMPQRQEELDYLIEPALPNGTRREIYSPIDGRLIVTLYEIPRLQR